MEQNKWTAEKIVELLLGGSADYDCYASIIDGDWVGYFAEEGDGYDNHDEPIMTIEELNISFTMNDFKTAEQRGNTWNVKSRANDTWYNITPLTPLKIN